METTKFLANSKFFRDTDTVEPQKIYFESRVAQLENALGVKPLDLIEDLQYTVESSFYTKRRGETLFSGFQGYYVVDNPSIKTYPVTYNEDKGWKIMLVTTSDHPSVVFSQNAEDFGNEEYRALDSGYGFVNDALLDGLTAQQVIVACLLDSWTNPKQNMGIESELIQQNFNEMLSMIPKED